MSIMRSLPFLLGVTLAAMAASPAVTEPRSRGVVEGVPTYVVDGDTLRFGKARVRLFGVDAPELRDKKGAPNPAGEGAKRALRTLVGSGPVRCVGVGQPLSYGRLVAICRTAAGVDLSHAIVAEGWAKDVPKFSGGQYLPAELAARWNRRGMFAIAPSL